jgi:hypothetical protein
MYIGDTTMSVCTECPFRATLQSSENLINVLKPKDAEKNLGGIALTTRCLEEVAENIACEKPFQNTTTGQIDCPLRDSVYGARSFAFQPINQVSFNVDLEALTSNNVDETNHNTGQYL